MDKVIAFLKEFKGILYAVAAIAAVITALLFLNRLKPANSTGVVSSDFQKPVEGKPIPKPDLVVPIGEKPDDYSGQVTMTVKDTVTKADTVGTVHQHEVTILIPKADRPPDYIARPNTEGVTVVYQPVKKPWVEIKPGLFIGASLNKDLQPSVYGGLLGLQAFQAIDLGIGACRDGLGPMGGYEFWREFTLFGQWNVITFGPTKQQFSAGIAYRF